MICVKRILSALLALSLALSGCAALAEAGEATPTEAPEVVLDTLVVGSTTEMSGNFFSEMFGNNTSDLDVRTLLHAYNLMEWQSELGAYGVNRSVVSGFAAQEDAEGNRTYTVALYSNLKYSDGTPITAADYAFAMLLSMAPEMREIGAQTVYSDYIVGADAYCMGETNVLTGMRILNETMLSITVKAAYEPFFYELGLLDYVPYPIHVIAPECEVADNGEGVLIRNIDPEIKEPIFTAELLRKTILDPDTGYLTHPSVVSGAYVLDGYDAQTHTAFFSINPYFSGDARGMKPMIEHLVYKPVSPDTMVQELADGTVDLLHKCTSASVIDAGMQLAWQDEYQMVNYPRTGYSFVSFSCERAAVSGSAVRKAIAYCLDKDEIVQRYVRNYGLGVKGYYGMGQWMYPLVAGTQEPPIEAPGDDATSEEIRAYEAAKEAWDNLTLDDLKAYELNVSEAVRLLVNDGWTLNRDGEDFDAERDDARCKVIDGQLVALDLKMLYPEGNEIGDAWEETFITHLAEAGIRVTVDAKPMAELLDVYYRNVEREYDMIYLATNFATVFDPSYTFSPADAYQGVSNRSGVADDELYRLAVDMRRTEPGDVLSYCQKWLRFQQRWVEVLPAIPVYSNVYFDFHDVTLRHYVISAGLTWADAIIGAYLGEPQEDEPADEPAGEDIEIVTEE